MDHHARDFDIDAPVKLLQDVWSDAGRDGAPQIVALDFKPDPDKLARWAGLEVTEVLFSLPDQQPTRSPVTSNGWRASWPHWFRTAKLRAGVVVTPIPQP